MAAVKRVSRADGVGDFHRESRVLVPFVARDQEASMTARG